MVTEMVVAFGPSDIYCSLDLLWADVVMFDGQNQHPQGCLLKVNFLDGQT